VLVIRPEQMKALAGSMNRVFAGRLAARLTRRLPESCVALGEDALNHLIEHSIEKGKRYGMTERDVAILAELMLQFPPDFDQSPEFSWTRSLLEQRGPESAGRMEVLYFRMTGQTVEG